MNMNFETHLPTSYSNIFRAKLVLVNQSKHALRLLSHVDFGGNVWKYPVPSAVEAGTGASFLHVGKLNVGRSSGALSYRLGESGTRLDVAWATHALRSNWVTVDLKGYLKIMVFNSTSLMVSIILRV